MPRWLSALLLVLLAALALPLHAQGTLPPDDRMALFADFESQLLRERGELLDREAGMADPIWIEGGDGVWLVDGAVMDRRLRTLALLVEDSGISRELMSNLPHEYGVLFHVWDAFGAEVRGTLIGSLVLDPLRARSEGVRRTTLASYDALIGHARAGFDAALLERERPRLPEALQPYAGLGLRNCGCFSSDGRNDACRNNGCAPPPGHSMICFWECDDREGNRLRVNGLTSERMR